MASHPTRCRNLLQHLPSTGSRSIVKRDQDPPQRGAESSDSPLLEVSGLKVGFEAVGCDAADGNSTVNVVRGVDLSLRRGDALGLVGESGCGKTMTCLAILGVLPHGARRSAGRIAVDGVELPQSGRGETWRRVRGRKLAMVFQEPAAALNPVLRIGTQLSEVLRLPRPRRRGGLGRRETRRRGIEWLQRVALPDAERRWRSYPGELSGGQQQRVMLAMALAAGADLLVADEPTTALDVTVQAQILDLLATLRRDLGLTLLLVTHDLAVVSQTCDEVAIMDAGRIVEKGAATDLFARPKHDVTRKLLAAAGGLRRD